MIIFIFTAILALLFIYLSIGVIKQRKIFKIPLGDDDNIQIKKWVRAQSNFVEYTPFTLLILFFLEYSEINQIEIITLASLFTLGRFLHVYGLTKEEKYENNQLIKPPKFRKSGMQLTFLVIIYSSLRLIHLYVSNL